jgi:serine/threonine-protein kinase
MLDLTAEQFAQRALHLNLIDERQLELVWSRCGTHEVPQDEFCNLLVRQELLTNYQVERLLRGERTGFFYGDYKVLYLVGTGSFARVYRAVHQETGQVVAVKVLRKRYSEKPLETDKFMREGRMGATLSHPHIVPIYGVHNDRRTFFLVMAFVEGQSLREFLKIRKKIEPVEATEFMAGVMSGLAYAAEKGITHRDMKLSNVLISSDGQPQLVDFGLAAMTSGPGDPEGGFSNTRTIDYAGLEKLTGVRKDDPRSDIYFAGCIYYHMLCGVPPLPDTRDRLQRMNISRFREVVPISQREPGLPSHVDNIVTKAMELDVAKRYASPVEMLVDLQKAVKAIEKDREKEWQAKHAEKLEGNSLRVLLVESTTSVQNALRAELKKHGYRVLVIEDPERSFQRFVDDPHAADCVIISLASLGRAGLTLYRQLASHDMTKHLPLILLLAKSQASIRDQLNLSDNHVAVTMPLRMSQLRSVLRSLVSAV